MNWPGYCITESLSLTRTLPKPPKQTRGSHSTSPFWRFPDDLSEALGRSRLVFRSPCRPNSCTGLLRSSIHWLQPSPRFASQRLSEVSNLPFGKKLVPLEPSMLLNQLCLHQKRLSTSGISSAHRLQLIVKLCLRPYLLGQAFASSPANVSFSLLCPKALLLNTLLHHLTCYIMFTYLLLICYMYLFNIEHPVSLTCDSVQ